MEAAQKIAILNRLLQTLVRSLPQYLRLMWHEPPADPDGIVAAITNLAVDQTFYSQRVARAISNLGAAPEGAPFSTRFGAMNDLSLPFLLSCVLEYHAHDTEVIRDCRDALTETPRLEALAEEVLGNAFGHLETLRQLAADPVES